MKNFITNHDIILFPIIAIAFLWMIPLSIVESFKKAWNQFEIDMETLKERDERIFRTHRKA